MKIEAYFTALGKFTKPWTKDGKVNNSYAVNIMQNNGMIIDTIRLTSDLYEKIEAGREYRLIAHYMLGKNGGYLRIEDIQPTTK